MSTRTRLGAILPLASFLAACEGQGHDEAGVRVRNRTEREVRVYYVDEDERSRPLQRSHTLPPGQETVLDLQDVEGNGELSVVSEGKMVVWDVDLDAPEAAREIDLVPEVFGLGSVAGAPEEDPVAEDPGASTEPSPAE